MQAVEHAVRAAAAAGMFYPGGAVELRRLVLRLLGNVAAEPAEVCAVIVPHAGYAYSGLCAAQVYARVRVPATVVAIGPNHFGAGCHPEAACLWRAGAFATPLGDVAVDEAFADALLDACPRAVHDAEAHAVDHALEVQLPFLQVRRGGEPLAIVPILLEWDDWARCRELAATIAFVAQGRAAGSVLVVASSDMTHFEPADVALRQDQPALEAIRRLNGRLLLRRCRERRLSMCGVAPVAVALEYARILGATRGEVVAHTHSGVASGDESSVVSYAGVVIT